MSSPADAPAIPGYRAGSWKVDPERSRVAFSIRQLVSKVRGRFIDYDATIITTERFLDSSVNVTIELDSLDTANQRRDKHLRGPQVLDVDQHPTMSYRSTGLKQIDGQFVIDGELTLNDHTRSLPLDLLAHEFTGDPAAGCRAAFSAAGLLSRRAFGLSIPLDGGGMLVADKIPISLQLEAFRTQ